MARTKVKAAADQTVHPEADAKEWGWRAPERGMHYRTCSWCGSINPDDLAAEAGWLPAWADQKYGWPHKFYVDIANREQNMLFCLGSTNSKEGHPQWGHAFSAWLDVNQLNAEQRAACERDGFNLDTATYVLIGTRDHHHAKFYTIHLKDSSISEGTKASIMRVSGVRLTFTDDGKVAWEPYAGRTVEEVQLPDDFAKHNTNDGA